MNETVEKRKKQMDFTKTRLNCSRLGVIMAEPKGALTDKMFERLQYLKDKSILTPNQEVERIELQFRMDHYNPKALSKGCMMYLTFVYQYMKYGKQYQINPAKPASQMIRGTKSEKASLELVKRVTGKQFYRNKSILRNEFLKGQLDAIDGETLNESNMVADIKSCYSHFDFMKKILSEEAIRADNFQMQGYLALTGKDYGEVYYCLADFTEQDIEMARKQLMDILCPDGFVTDYFLEEWDQIYRSMMFQHVPDEERVIVRTVERDDKIIGKIYEKIEFCREWLSSFEIKHQRQIAAQIEQWQNGTSLQ